MSQKSVFNVILFRIAMDDISDNCYKDVKALLNVNYVIMYCLKKKALSIAKNVGKCCGISVP